MHSVGGKLGSQLLSVWGTGVGSGGTCAQCSSFPCFYTVRKMGISIKFLISCKADNRGERKRLV